LSENGWSLVRTFGSAPVPELSAIFFAVQLQLPKNYQPKKRELDLKLGLYNLEASKLHK
jgi:hypothetical protein